MKFGIQFSLVTAIATFASCVEEFPSIIDKCKYEDEECLVNAWNKYTKLVDTDGIPGLIPQLHQTFVEKQVINMGSNALNFKIVYTNVTVTGMATTNYEKVTGFKRDPKTMSNFMLSGVTPFISIKGKYEGKGKLLLVPVTGKGEAEIQYFNVKFKITVSTKTEERDGEEYLVITNVQCSYDTDRNHYRFGNVLNNKELSDGVNKLVNENQDIFNKEVMEPTATSFARVFKQIISSIFKRYPYRSFFLD